MERPSSVTLNGAEAEIDTLEKALHECLDLCNTLAAISSSTHRGRIFSRCGTGDEHETAWEYCWELCQTLYDELPEERDALLRACWELAEMLFSLRQNEIESKAAYKNLLESVLEACSKLCGLFLERWNRLRFKRAAVHSVGLPRSPTKFEDTLASPPNISNVPVFGTKDSFDAVAKWLNTTPTPLLHF